MEEKTAKLFAERKNRVDTAIALGTPDRVPVAPFIASYMQRCSGSSYKDIFTTMKRPETRLLNSTASTPSAISILFPGLPAEKPMNWLIPR